MLVYDFEVFACDWMVCIADLSGHQDYTFINDLDGFRKFYQSHLDDVWVGFNSRHYDQYIMKAVLAGFNPKELNDYIIVKKQPGWKWRTDDLRKYPFTNYDVMPNPPVGLKTLEGIMGSDIEETSVPFDIDRPLTDEEIELTVKYCRHDVEQTALVLANRMSEFKAQLGIVKAFNLPIRDIGLTEARITAKVLDCERQDHAGDDEYDYEFLPCIRLDKYACVMRWFDRAVQDTDPDGKMDDETFRKNFYKRSLTMKVAGVPHTFGFGGLHGAPEKPVHEKGLILHVDVGSYYPSMLIAHDLVTRGSRSPEKYKGIYDTRMELKHAGKKAEQAPYKKLLNSLSGAMKDKYNPAYDPRRNNEMCINGQLLLLDLIEKLEAVPGFRLIQSNTDGLIIKIPDDDRCFDLVDDICYEWECRVSTEKCKILLELDVIDEIYQKDVNNYLWISGDSVERKGAYVKSLSMLDNDLPILNDALVEYMVHGTPVEHTIRGCHELMKFQKIVKLSDKYTWVEHEVGRTETYRPTPRSHPRTRYVHTDRYDNKSYRVFASKSPRHGRILKCKKVNGEVKKDKFANTPDHAVIINGDVTNTPVPDYLDYDWYIEHARSRLKDFGVSV